MPVEPLCHEDGVLLIDKPAGVTSAGVIRVLKGKLRPKKIGHGGTLDPFATGLLVVLLGKGTKLSSLFLDGEKSYSGVIALGVATDTEDITGKEVGRDELVESRFPESVWQEREAEIKNHFCGEMLQRPPAFSALKVNGQRSYALARKGVEVEHQPRAIHLFELRLKFLRPNEIEFFVRCSKGTYIRSLARDIGEFLGTLACLQSLRRESSSVFELSECFGLEQVELENVGKKVLSAEVILERLAHKPTSE